jgi:hypothetical protein
MKFLAYSKLQPASQKKITAFCFKELVGKQCNKVAYWKMVRNRGGSLIVTHLWKNMNGWMDDDDDNE